MPFGDDRDPKQDPRTKPKVGLKIKNEDSMFANQVKKPTQQDFEAAVREASTQSMAYKERAVELAPLFIKLLNDKTLIENKTSFTNEIEREIIGKLTQLAIDINTDELEADGMGSIGIIALLLRCVLIQRDKINSLDYRLTQLEKRIQTLDAEKVSK